MNKDDDLCFTRYLIVTKFLCKEEHIPYLLYGDKEERFKNHYISRRRPQVNPDMIEKMDLFFPHEEIREGKEY